MWNGRVRLKKKFNPKGIFKGTCCGFFSRHCIAKSASAGAAVAAVDWVRDGGSVKNWCALLTAAERREEQRGWNDVRLLKNFFFTFFFLLCITSLKLVFGCGRVLLICLCNACGVISAYFWFVYRFFVFWCKTWGGKKESIFSLLNGGFTSEAAALISSFPTVFGTVWPSGALFICRPTVQNEAGKGAWVPLEVSRFQTVVR